MKRLLCAAVACALAVLAGCGASGDIVASGAPTQSGADTPRATQPAAARQMEIS